MSLDARSLKTRASARETPNRVVDDAADRIHRAKTAKFSVTDIATVTSKRETNVRKRVELSKGDMANVVTAMSLRLARDLRDEGPIKPRRRNRRLRMTMRASSMRTSGHALGLSSGRADDLSGDETYSSSASFSVD